VSQQPGQVRERHRLSRERFRRFLAEQPGATVLMEACGSAHHWTRYAEAHGHRAVLVPPHVVRPTCCETRRTGRCERIAGGRSQ
jgi:transposase